MSPFIRRLRAGLTRSILGLGLLTTATLGIGCGEAEPPTPQPQPGPVTIAQGIYGYATSYGDLGPPDQLEQPVRDLTVAVYFGDGVTDGADPVLASVRTDDQGFFQLALAPGSYRLCDVPEEPDPRNPATPTCARVELGEQLQHWDYSTGFAPRSWDRRDQQNLED